MACPGQKEDSGFQQAPRSNVAALGFPLELEEFLGGEVRHADVGGALDEAGADFPAEAFGKGEVSPHAEFVEALGERDGQDREQRWGQQE